MDVRGRNHMDTCRAAFQSDGEPAGGLTETPKVRTRDGGFALPIVVFALVLLGVIGVAALQTSRDELLSGVAVSSSNAAFYAAEAGIHSAVSNWDQDGMDTLMASPGDSLVGSWTTLENRCSYQLVIRRVDGGDLLTRLYSIESTGQARGLNRATRRISIIVKSPYVTGLAFGGDVIISGNPIIKGACSELHSNGDLNVGGTATVGGNVSTSGSATVSGTLQDTLSNPVTPTTGAPRLPIPALDPADYCDAADFIFTGGFGLKVSTSETQNLATGTWWGWKWSSGTYITDNDFVEGGVYCMDGNAEISNQLGSSSTPLAISILTTKSVTIPGDPYIVPAHADSILIIAEGDVKLNGNPSAGEQNFEGLVYAGAQCEISGTPVMYGQLICRDDPNPAGSQDWVSQNRISGDLRLTYNCGVVPPEGKPIGGRMWNHVW